MTVFDMLKELQEQPRDNQCESWILIWSPHWNMWQCNLMGWEKRSPLKDDGPSNPFLRESFMDVTARGCVRQAWESTKEAGE